MFQVNIVFFAWHVILVTRCLIDLCVVLLLFWSNFVSVYFLSQFFDAHIIIIILVVKFFLALRCGLVLVAITQILLSVDFIVVVTLITFVFCIVDLARWIA